jgi:nitroreductase
MEVDKAIRTFQTINQFKSDLVPDNVIHDILEAGRFSACPITDTSCHFIVIQESTMLHQLGDLAPVQSGIAQAPMAIVVTSEWTRSFEYVLVGIKAIESMMLAAWSAGIGSNWLGYTGDKVEIRLKLQIPDHLKTLAIVPFGYPAHLKKKICRAFKQVVSSEQFGRPLIS